MYINECKDYPICSFDLNDKEVTKISLINLISIWYNQNFDNTITPIDKTKYIIIVKLWRFVDNPDEEEQFQAKKYECCIVKPTQLILIEIFVNSKNQYMEIKMKNI